MVVQRIITSLNLIETLEISMLSTEETKLNEVKSELSNDLSNVFRESIIRSSVNVGSCFIITIDNLITLFIDLEIPEFFNCRMVFRSDDGAVLCVDLGTFNTVTALLTGVYSSIVVNCC